MLDNAISSDFSQEEKFLPLFSPESHSLNVAVAHKTKSTNAAILFNYILLCLNLNKKKKINQIHGKTWICQSIPHFAQHFSYLSNQQIKDSLTLLVKHGYLIKEKFSHNKFNHTNWYALTDEEYLQPIEKIATVKQGTKYE